MSVRARIRSWLDPDHAALLKRTRHVRYYGRWMTLEAYLDERQFAMVLEVGTGDP